MALTLLVLIGSAFAVVRADSATSDGPDLVAAPAPTRDTTNDTAALTAVGLVAGELAAQGRLTTATSTTGSFSASPATGEAFGLPRLTAAAAESEATPSTTTTSTTSTSEPTTTSAPSTTVVTTTTAPATTVPETTTTTVAATTTTTSPPETTTTTSPPSGVVLSEAEARSMFALHFAAEDVDRAIEVAICESSLNTGAYNPAGYGGLFQHAISAWDDRSAAAGWAGASIYDGNANAAVAAWLVYTDGWHHWPNC